MEPSSEPFNPLFIQNQYFEEREETKKNSVESFCSGQQRPEGLNTPDFSQKHEQPFHRTDHLTFHARSNSKANISAKDIDARCKNYTVTFPNSDREAFDSSPGIKDLAQQLRDNIQTNTCNFKKLKQLTSITFSNQIKHRATMSGQSKSFSKEDIRAGIPLPNFQTEPSFGVRRAERLGFRSPDSADRKIGMPNFGKRNIRSKGGSPTMKNTTFKN